MTYQTDSTFFATPGVQCMIPLFYVAWADRVLTPSEIRVLKDRAQALEFLEPKEQKLLLTWADPTKPPSRYLFKIWEIELKQAAEQLPAHSGRTLVDLGLEMAKEASIKTAGKAANVNWSLPSIREDLEVIESNLKAINITTYQSILAHEASEELQQLHERGSFPVEKMKTLLDGQFHPIRAKMRSLLVDPVFHYQSLPIKEDYREQVMAWCKLLADQGLGALAYPNEYGGKHNMGDYAAVFEFLGHHDLSLAIKFGVQFGLFGGSIQFLGTDKHHKAYLESAGTLELAGCFAMTETGHGSNVRNLETTATYDEDSHTLLIHTPNYEAGKEYIGNALHGEIATVFAQLIVKGVNHGVHAVLVQLRDTSGNLLPGRKVEDCGYKMGLNGVDNGRIWFDKVRVPVDNLLNRYGAIDENGNYSSPIENPSRRFFTMLGTLVGGRVCVPRAGLSVAKSGLTIAIKYALKRRQFGPSSNEPETLLLDYPSHQRRLMPLLAKTYALDFALKYLTDRYLKRTEEDIREIETLAAGLKSYATWFTTHAIQQCREACGGKGYLSENRFADLKADSDVFTTFEGDNTVLMQLVAKGVLSEFRNEFHEEGTIAVLRYLGGRISTAFAEMNPIIIRNTDRNHLFSNDFQLNAFKFRETRLLYSLANRLRGLIKNGQNAYDAYLQCQSHMLHLAEAFVERLVLEQFMEAVDASDEALKPVLNQLVDLYALHTIEQHKGWYLEQDYMIGVKTKAIRRLVDELCGTIRLEAAALVASFDIPPSCLAAPIAKG